MAVCWKSAWSLYRTIGFFSSNWWSKTPARRAYQRSAICAASSADAFPFG